MTTSEVLNAVLSGLIRINLAGAAAALAVMALRLLARRLFGAEAAYRLWATVPMAMAACLLPARVVVGAAAAPGLPPVLSNHAAALLALWVVGVAVAVGVLARAQIAFEREARAGRGGPAVAGILCPRVIMPADDGRYTPQERELVRAHERAHIARQDPRASAAAAALQALGWFNPLLHLGAQMMRLDQELACDATVLRRRPRDRALYARTLLKTQLAARPLPFGCYWPARSVHPLEVRVGLLRTAGRGDGLIGGFVVAAAVLLAGGLAWAAKPPMPAMVFSTLQIEPEPPAMSVMLIRAAPAAAPR